MSGGLRRLGFQRVLYEGFRRFLKVFPQGCIGGLKACIEPLCQDARSGCKLILFLQLFVLLFFWLFLGISVVLVMVMVRVMFFVITVADVGVVVLVVSVIIIVLLGLLLALVGCSRCSWCYCAIVLVLATGTVGISVCGSRDSCSGCRACRLRNSFARSPTLGQKGLHQPDGQQLQRCDC